MGRRRPGEGSPDPEQSSWFSGFVLACVLLGEAFIFEWLPQELGVSVPSLIKRTLSCPCRASFLERFPVARLPAWGWLLAGVT